jgi:hypothetical protein
MAMPAIGTGIFKFQPEQSAIFIFSVFTGSSPNRGTNEKSAEQLFRAFLFPAEPKNRAKPMQVYFE